jgi:hypothetical protein
VTTVEIRPVSVNGWDGTEPPPDEMRDVVAAACWRVARYHNAMVDIARREAAAEAAYEQAKETAWEAWTALSTAATADWAAAHHRWVLTEDELADAAGGWHRIARRYEEDAERAFPCERDLGVYQQVSANAGVPQLTGPGAGRGWWSVESDTQTERRQREDAAARTLRLLTS